MAILSSTLAVSSAQFASDAGATLALLERVRAIEKRAHDRSAASRERFEQRGQLLPRERVGLLLDPGALFLELCSLAGYCRDKPDPDRSVAGAGLIAGIGMVSGVRCVVVASDAGIDAGALQPVGLDKLLRLQEIALESRLPYLQLLESAGANLLDYRVEDFVRGGELFRNLARLSAAGLPVITVTHGSSTAGGAYQTGLSDVIILVRDRSRVFLAGPPLLRAATGEIATEEDLGGALMHTTVSGLGDHLAVDGDRGRDRLSRGAEGVVEHHVIAGLDVTDADTIFHLDVLIIDGDPVGQHGRVGYRYLQGLHHRIPVQWSPWLGASSPWPAPPFDRKCRVGS